MKFDENTSRTSPKDQSCGHEDQTTYKKHDPSIQVVPINMLSSLTFSMRKEPLLYKNIGYC